MLGIDKPLLRGGGNQLGVLTMAAGLIAIFIESVPGPNEYYLVFGGLGAYLLSATTWKPKHTPQKPPPDKSVDH